MNQNENKLLIEINTSISSLQEMELRRILNKGIQEISMAIDISTLERIIITENFTETVIRVQKEYEMLERGHTSRNDSWVVAKTLHTGRKKDLRQTVIINICNFDERYGDSWFHTLYHELCHVHDNFHKRTIFSDDGVKGNGLNELEKNLLNHADIIWSEYIAVRLSAKTIPIGNPEKIWPDDLFFSYLIRLIRTCKANVEEAIKNYDIDRDISSLFIICQEETLILLKIAATTKGYIDGLNLGKHELASKIDEEIEETYFYDIWIGLGETLKMLYDNYPNWNDVYQLADLSERIKECWNKVGIYPRNLENKKDIYIDVSINKI